MRNSSTSGPLSGAFATSATRAGAPRDLLVAIAKVEDGLAMPAEREEIDEENEVPAAGPLQLRRGKLDTLRRGSELVGVSEVELRRKSDLALEAGALVLAELGERTGARADDLTSWAEAVGEMSGFADALHRDSYVHQVFATLARGGSFEGRDGEIVHLPAHDIPPSLTLQIDTRVHALADAQFPNTEWIPTSCTNKCTPTRDGNKVEYVVVHDTEGGWNASVATLQNDPNKSAHYIIGEDGRIAQFVTEETTAWHAGNFHFNQRSIGIEHVGYATKPFPEPLYAKSAKLVEHLTKKYGIARDRAHIIGHDQIPNGNRIAKESAPCLLSPKGCRNSPNYGGASGHTDPGVWEWPTYMVRFGGTAKCNDVTNLWNCSNDKKKAFRCVNDKVEVATCNGVGGCEVQELGVDDKCNVAPQTSSSMPATEDEDGPASDGSDPEAEDSQRERSGAAGYLSPNASRARNQADSGCSVGSGPSGRAGGPIALLALAAVAAARTRRRSRAE